MSTPARPHRSLRLVTDLPPAARVRRIPVVAASLRQCCAVCSDGGRQRQWLQPGSGRVLGEGGCAHCGWGLPIAYPPMLVDQPKDAS